MGEMPRRVQWPSDLPALQGRGISLRPWEPGDAEVRLQASLDPDILKFTTVSECQSIEEAEAWIAERRLESQRGESAFFVIDAQGTAVGSMNLIAVDLHNETAELGYWLLPSSRGSGYASEAITMLTQWTLGLGFKRLYLTTNLDNAGSQRLARNAGFGAEGVLRSYGYLRDGTREDVILFGLVAAGWEASR